jgi:hypothetical protein
MVLLFLREAKYSSPSTRPSGFSLHSFSTVSLNLKSDGLLGASIFPQAQGNQTSEEQDAAEVHGCIQEWTER